MEKEHLQKPEHRLEQADIVIVGNGIAGLTAAVEARRFNPDTSIAIITDQNYPTINTPALKQFAIDKLSHQQLLAYPPGIEQQERIHLVRTRVEAINAREHYVMLNGQRAMGYKSLLLTTGSTPLGMSENIPGRKFKGVLTLHRFHDYLELRRCLPSVQEAVVIGSGAHAIETVMSLLHWRIRVHWLIRGKTFMNGILDAKASEIVLNNLRRNGVNIYTQTEVMGVMGRMGLTVGVITNRQQMIPCQLVLCCTGVRPQIDLAKTCNLPMLHQKGILVDQQLRTSVRDVYAAGDVAALYNPITSDYETRAQWYSAVTQGRMVGALLGGNTEINEQSFGVQWHATHLGELSMLTVGNPLAEGRDIETLTDKSQGTYRRLAINGDRLIGYLSLGHAQPDSLAIKRIIDEGHAIRKIIKPLLKGRFDAREYLSQLNSQAAQGILTGQLSLSGSPAQFSQGNRPPLLPGTISTPKQGPIQMPAAIAELSPRYPLTPINTGKHAAISDILAPQPPDHAIKQRG